MQRQFARRIASLEEFILPLTASVFLERVRNHARRSGKSFDSAMQSLVTKVSDDELQRLETEFERSDRPARLGTTAWSGSRFRSAKIPNILQTSGVAALPNVGRPLTSPRWRKNKLATEKMVPARTLTLPTERQRR